MEEVTPMLLDKKEVSLSKKRDRQKEIESINTRKRTFKDIFKWDVWDAIYPKSEWLEYHLAVGFERRKRVVQKLIFQIESKDSVQKVKCMENLYKIVSQDPWMCDDLDRDFLLCLFGFFKLEETLEIKMYAAMVLRAVLSFSANNRETVAELINVPILINSESCGVQTEGLILFRTMILVIPEHYKSVPKGVFESLVSIVRDEFNSTDSDLLRSASLTLSAVCQELPKLSVEMLESAVSVLVLLIDDDDAEVVQPACIGLAHLHNGNRKFLLIRGQFEAFQRLVNIFFYEDRGLAICALEAVGCILRWCDDVDNEALLLLNAFPFLASMLNKYEEDMVVLHRVCWVISIVTASKEHIEAVIKHQLIDRLLEIVEKAHFEVKVEAVWAISNAILGASSNDEIQYLSERCIRPLFNLLDCSDWQVVILCLEGLVKLQAVKVTYFGEPIDSAVGFENLNMRSNGETVQPLKKSRGHDGSTNGLLVIPTCSLGDDPETCWRSEE